MVRGDHQQVVLSFSSGKYEASPTSNSSSDSRKALHILAVAKEHVEIHQVAEN